MPNFSRSLVRGAPLAAALLVASGCYRVTVVANETPVPAMAPSVDVPWAHSFVYGLVPPAVVTTAAKCPGGVQQVVTERSFLNGLVAVITYSLYTPIHITATCAGAGAAAGAAAGGQASLHSPTAAGRALVQALEAARVTPAVTQP